MERNKGRVSFSCCSLTVYVVASSKLCFHRLVKSRLVILPAKNRLVIVFLLNDTKLIGNCFSYMKAFIDAQGRDLKFPQRFFRHDYLSVGYRPLFAINMPSWVQFLESSLRRLRAGFLNEFESVIEALGKEVWSESKASPRILDTPKTFERH